MGYLEEELRVYKARRNTWLSSLQTDPSLCVMVESGVRKVRGGLIAFTVLFLCIVFSNALSITNPSTPSFLHSRNWDPSNEHITYDNYSLIIKGKRVFLQYVTPIIFFNPFSIIPPFAAFLP